MQDTNFDDQVKQLAVLALDKNTVNEFTSLYQQLLEDCYNEMFQPENAEKTIAGLYAERAKMLKGILHEEIKFLGGEVPQRRADA
jgi:hypothetical protein